MDENTVKPGQTVAPTPPTPPPADPEQAPVTPEASEPTAEQPANQGPESSPGGTAELTAADGESITWTASEFIAHAKSFGWYAALALAAIAAAALIYVLTKDPVSSAVIIVAAFFLGFYAGHKPRELEYRLDQSGLSIGQKQFGYEQFKSFSVLPEGAFSSIVLMPLKRFAVPTTLYFAPEDEDRIVSMLADRLPMENRGHDAIDRLMHRIHF